MAGRLLTTQDVDWDLERGPSTSWWTSSRPVLRCRRAPTR